MRFMVSSLSLNVAGFFVGILCFVQ